MKTAETSKELDLEELVYEGSNCLQTEEEESAKSSFQTDAPDRQTAQNILVSSKSSSIPVSEQ